MTKYRCLNNPFFYCSGGPIPGGETVRTYAIYENGHRIEKTETIQSCKLDLKFCGYAQTWEESLNETLSAKR